MEELFYLPPRAQALVKSSELALEDPRRFAADRVHLQKHTCRVELRRQHKPPVVLSRLHRSSLTGGLTTKVSAVTATQRSTRTASSSGAVQTCALSRKTAFPALTLRVRCVSPGTVKRSTGRSSLHYMTNPPTGSWLEVLPPPITSKASLPREIKAYPPTFTPERFLR